MVTGTANEIVPIPVLGVILAGGSSRRYGSDKALMRLGERSLLAHVIERMRPQVDQLVISGPSRPGCSLPAIPDGQSGQGPLMGLCTAMHWAEARQLPLIATVACDTPFIPADCIERFRNAIGSRHCAVASRSGEMQPTCTLWRTSAIDRVEAALASGVRSLRAAIGFVDNVIVEFQQESDREDPFFNINRPQDMEIAYRWLDRDRLLA
ncbi:MAG: molybdenum cofactor guanylyltransferase [Alphaproteobacteria bacterium]|nr:molybdenum cofactor guanylyltransferase [Alphaproteobacteria bacterium]